MTNTVACSHCHTAVRAPFIGGSSDVYSDRNGGETCYSSPDGSHTPGYVNRHAVIRAYLTAAVWTCQEETRIYGAESIGVDTADALAEDCTAFIRQAGALLDGLDSEQVGHDFHLTRNGHGAGFWDRGLGHRGDLLTELAHSFGECELYATDHDVLVAW